jgi:hypothetical protein
MQHSNETVYAKASITATLGAPDIELNLRLDTDGAYRWYEAATGADTEVSGATIKDATNAFAMAWKIERVHLYTDYRDARRVKVTYR